MRFRSPDVIGIVVSDFQGVGPHNQFREITRMRVSYGWRTDTLR
jgi:hypothetical protein